MTDLTPEQHEILSLIAQGDEIIIKLAKETVKELRLNGFVKSSYSNQAFVYEVTPKGYEILKKMAKVETVSTKWDARDVARAAWAVARDARDARDIAWATRDTNSVRDATEKEE